MAGPEALDEIEAIGRDGLAESWSRQSLAAALDCGARLHVCRLRRRIVGYLLSQAVIDEIHILQLVVAPEARRRGIGRALVASLLREAGRRRVLLEVRASNVAAQALYRSLGFVRIAVRPRYYAARGAVPAEDAVVMERATA